MITGPKKGPYENLQPDLYRHLGVFLTQTDTLLAFVYGL